MIEKIFKSIQQTQIAIICCITLCSPFIMEANSTVRAALDIGSGATKLRVAELDLDAHKIERILETQSFSIQYQEDLVRSSDGDFTSAIMDKGIAALKEAACIAQKHGAEKVIAVATAAFRKAGNSEAYIDRIRRETGIEVNIIDQGLEGELAFKAVRSQYGIEPQNLIVWDIGGGSFQLTAVDEEEQLLIHRGTEASTPFKNFVIDSIQHRSSQAVSSPNPLNFKEILQASLQAQRLAERVDEVFKEKIARPETVTVGVGNIFGYQISEMFNQNYTITREGMGNAVAGLAGKSDQDVGGGDFANVYVTNALLVLGFMEGLNIQKMEISDINPADGAFFHAPFWK